MNLFSALMIIAFTLIAATFINVSSVSGKNEEFKTRSQHEVETKQTYELYAKSLGVRR